MENPLITTSAFLPERDVLYVTADLSNYLIDYYIHLKQFVGKINPDHDETLRQLLACFAIHLTLRPATETHAWTLHMIGQEPYSLFVTGSAEEQFIVGHAITEDVRHTDVTMLHAQVVRQGDTSKSAVQVKSSSPRVVVEHFYTQSEQLPIRFHVDPNSDKVSAVAATPGYDEEWFSSVNLASIEETYPKVLKKMRTCKFTFLCDCSPEKLLPFFRSIDDKQLKELYQGEDTLIISCPRCGKVFEVSEAQARGEMLN